MITNICNTHSEIAHSPNHILNFTYFFFSSNFRHSNSGSFVRPKKVEFGATCFEAIQERYGIIDDENAGVIQEELYVKGTNKNTVVEMVGAQKVNLQQG
jgi:hypothetical protein